MRGSAVLAAGAFLICIGLGGPGSAAEDAAGDLRARQVALSQQLLSRPDDLDLMFAYAEVSLALEDIEPAISTLERMLIYRQDLPRVRLELAVAYFRLGSYETANLYFDQVLADPGTPADVRVRIARYQEEIARRLSPNQFRMTALAGITFSTNANLGPNNTQVVLGGVAATLVAGQPAEDVGLRTVLDIGHSYDLGGPNTDTWNTEFGFFGLRYFSEDQGDLAFFRLRTGPRLALTAENFGPKIRPFVEASYLNSADDSLYWQAGLGVEYTESLASDLAVFAETSVQYRDFFDRVNDDEDAVVAGLRGGLAFRPMPDLVLRGTLLGQHEAADAAFNSNTEIGARIAAEYQYVPGIDWVDRKWSVRAFAEVRGRFFNEAEPAVDPNTSRRDIDMRGGISHVFTLRDGFGIQLDIDGLLRESNIPNFDLDNLGVSLSLQYRL